MARNILLTGDIVLDDARFLRLGFDMDEIYALREDDKDRYREAALFHAGDRKAGMERALEILRNDPDLAALFLHATQGNGAVYWGGDGASSKLDGRSMGVRIWHRRDGNVFSGENLFGTFLSDVRDALRLELGDYVVDERPVDPGQVVVDFVRKGALRSDIEEAETTRGERFVHVDRYVPVRFRHDASMDGSTGHAQRQSGEEVYFHKFECPFGTSYPSPIIVGSDAEAAYLYERALRGELDWNALFDDLDARGLLDRNMTERRRKGMVQDYSAQFSWMREQIVTDRTLRGMRIVAQSMLPSDTSFGRSVYDPELAPSPAHVLARYVDNPILLYLPSENGVVRSLDVDDKKETEVFTQSVPGDVQLLIVGSDTIGGREPGRRATQKVSRKEKVDRNGDRVVVREKRYEIPLKSKEDIEADYAAFSARLESIISALPDGTRVRLVTGNSSSLSDSVGVGTPRMVARFVREKGGRVGEWDYSHGRPEEGGRDGHKVTDDSLEAVLMPHFGDVFPVLCGRSQSVSFLLDPSDDRTAIVFDGRSGLAGDGVVCFSSSEDKGLRNVLSLGSLAASAGLPVIHVQENMSVELQREALKTGAAMSLSSFSGEVEGTGRLFEGEPRMDWVLSDCNVMSFIDPETGFSVPFVAERYTSSVLVSGHAFHSAMAAYVALVAVSQGKADRECLAGISRADGSVTELSKYLENILDGKSLEPSLQEKLLRQTVRLMVSSSSAFAARLLGLDDREVVMPVNRMDGGGLFVGLDGRGLNRFGMVLTDERRRLVEQREARRSAAEEENRKVMEEANRRQKLASGMHAEGQKVAGGFPESADAARDAVWFMGTNTPLQLMLKDDARSFDMWDDMGGDDPLVREKAARSHVDDGEGGTLDNTFVFLFPSDLAAVTGRRRVSAKADSRDLTGVTRTDPVTGKEFTCAFGIPVRFNNKGNEVVNQDDAPCSYRMDNDASNYAESLVLADSNARSTAIRHGMSLILPGRCRADGSAYYSLGQVFMENAWDRKQRKWVRNPHASPLNERLTDRYVSLLEQGRNFPLNCIPMPGSAYGEDLPEGIASDRRNISAQGRFIADLNLALRIANSTAVALGVPLRFPLDKDGRIDLGPGVPESFRAIAERKIDAFIGVVKEEDMVEGPLPCMERIQMYEASSYRDAMTGCGDIYLRPNDLVYAFGRYDFSMIQAGQTAPLHEMALRMDDGTVFTLVDAKLTRGLTLGEVNKYLSYSKNDERRFIVRTTDPEKAPQFLAVLSEYCRRAKEVKVEARLLRDVETSPSAASREGLDPYPVSGEDGDRSLEGFVNLLPSNSLRFAQSEHDIGREASIYNAVGTISQTAAHDSEGRLKSVKDGGVSARNVDGEDVSGVYWGWKEADDGFSGYAQIRYTLPDGRESPWMTVKDLELAKDIVMSMVDRTYRSDTRPVPEAAVLDMFMTAEAVRMAGRDFREAESAACRKSAVDDKVVTLQGPEVRGKESGDLPPDGARKGRKGRTKSPAI